MFCMCSVKEICIPFTEMMCLSEITESETFFSWGDTRSRVTEMLMCIKLH